MVDQIPTHNKPYKKITFTGSQYDNASLNCSAPVYIPRCSYPTIFSLHAE